MYNENQYKPSVVSNVGGFGSGQSPSGIQAVRVGDPQKSAIRELTGRIEKACSGLFEQGWRARQIADAYFGQMPDAANAGAPEGGPITSADALAAEALRLERALAELTIQLDRLSCI